jgi:hypothetical protein
MTHCGLYVAADAMVHSVCVKVVHHELVLGKSGT